ncbi:SIS domain-containing protein [Alteromonas sp. ASW11-19]|uniref:SIS domain-containing protein n=1 Tax=Alteromonas salexigens TaxID=2982530 RepID=A0ABT2VQ53_9ALTE|nr:SIS domain-containing protein [Alteromonas salexigens]MCU7555002.1 SIS domain-containing protein [Alteromonas salexigens]
MKSLIQQYQQRLCREIENLDEKAIEQLALSLLECCHERRQVFICGNGGSAGNAIHIANDFLYGIDPEGKRAMRVEALPANTSVLTCLGNDIGYANIFAHQLQVKARERDVLIVLSGSGNSNNIVNALTTARKLEMQTFAILGFTGGKARELADVAIHNDINDMQIAEDLQLIVGHMLMQYLHRELSL